MNLENIIPVDGPNIIEVKKYTKKYKNEIIVIKCGGTVLIDKKLFTQFIDDISILNKLGLNICLIHGGGILINKKMKEKNIPSKFINGLRITNKETINIVEEALIELNLEIINNLRKKNCNSQSVTKKSNLISVDPEKKELGFVGRPREVNENVLIKLLEKKEVPVIVPMGMGTDEETYNINADVAAGSIAKKLKSRRLLLMTDVDGVLSKDKKLIPEINTEKASKMINEGVITGGMIPKINTCLDAVKNGVTGVVIVDGRKPHSILFELFSDKGAGTLIRK
tara:strand:- start:1330 stop:2175 length:846 start_codon:yes stop_codon:yes gene_type:complete